MWAKLKTEWRARLKTNRHHICISCAFYIQTINWTLETWSKVQTYISRNKRRSKNSCHPSRYSNYYYPLAIISGACLDDNKELVWTTSSTDLSPKKPETGDQNIRNTINTLCSKPPSASAIPKNACIFVNTPAKVSIGRTLKSGNI